MKGIYLKKNNSLAHFIGFFDEDWFFVINNTALISASAFAHSDVERLLFKGRPSSIGKSAFKGCESLNTVIFGEPWKSETLADKGKSILKNLALATARDDYVIQANAFNGCESLTTLVLPKVDDTHKLVIENDAFCGCGSLRTVVAICDKIDFTGNPFAEEAEHLTFICKRDSDVARFAREYSYKIVYVD